MALMMRRQPSVSRYHEDSDDKCRHCGALRNSTEPSSSAFDNYNAILGASRNLAATGSLLWLAKIISTILLLSVFSALGLVFRHYKP